MMSVYAALPLLCIIVSAKWKTENGVGLRMRLVLKQLWTCGFAPSMGVCMCVLGEGLRVHGEVVERIS